MNLPGKLFGKLCDAITDAFSRADLEYLVRVNLDTRLEVILQQAPGKSNAQQLVSWAEQQGASRVRRLVEAIKEARPQHEAIQAIATEILRLPSLSAINTPTDKKPDDESNWEPVWEAIAFVAVLVVIFIIVALLLNADNSPQPTVPTPTGTTVPKEPRVVLRVKAAEPVLDQAGNLLERKALPQAKLTVDPVNFAAKRFVDGTTNAEGFAKIEVFYHPVDGVDSLSVYLMIVGAPPHLKDKMPLITDRYAAWKQGNDHIRKGGPFLISKNGGDGYVEVDVIPHSLAGRYYAMRIASVMDENAAKEAKATSIAGTGQVPDIDLKKSVHVAYQELNIDPSFQQATLSGWATKLARERPMLRVEAMDLRWESYNLRELVDKTAASVCYVIDDSPSSAKFSCSGFVLAKGVVASFMTTGKPMAVGFGTAGDARDKTFSVSKVLARFPEYNMVLLEVPGLTAPLLPLAASTSFSQPSGHSVAVLGYPMDDFRWPDELRPLLSEGGIGKKRIMPGKLLWLDDRGLSDLITLGHDATTSAGVSGGPVIDMDTGLVIGIHRGGKWTGTRKENEAFPIGKLLADQAVKNLLLERGAKIGNLPSTPPKPSSLKLEKIVGYNAYFLGDVSVPLPVIKDPLRIGNLLKGQVIDYVHFSLAIDEQRGFACFTASNVDRGLLLRVPRRPDIRWLLDPRVPKELQHGDELYRGNEGDRETPIRWDRGHLIRPASVAWGSFQDAELAYKAAFTFTNTCPQLAEFNQGGWRNLEDYVLTKLHPEAKKMCLFVGPAPEPDDYKYRGVQIPRLFWMVAVLQNPANQVRPFVHSYMLPQYKIVDGRPIPETTRIPNPEIVKVRVAEIERKTSLDFGKLRELDHVLDHQ